MNNKKKKPTKTKQNAHTHKTQKETNKQNKQKKQKQTNKTYVLLTGKNRNENEPQRHHFAADKNWDQELALVCVGPDTAVTK